MAALTLKLIEAVCLLLRIYVITPHGQQQCAGEYVRSAQSANGGPVRPHCTRLDA